MNNKSDLSSEVSNKFQQKSQEIMPFTVIFIDIFIVQSRQNKGDFALLSFLNLFYLKGEINVRAHFNVIADRRFSPLW